MDVGSLIGGRNRINKRRRRPQRQARRARRL